MHKKAAIAAVMICIAGPTVAQSYLETRLDVEPGVFTRHELVRIMQAANKDAEIAQIYRNRAALKEKMDAAAAQGAVVSTRSTGN